MEAVIGSWAALVASARAGDGEAFAALVTPQLGIALGAARVITGSSEMGEEAVQEALLSAWKGLDQIRDPQAFPAWFRRHVIRAAWRAARKERRVLVQSIQDVATEDPANDVVENEQMSRAFRTLASRDRAILTIVYLLDMSQSQAAAILGIPIGTVKSRVHYALQRLRESGTYE